MNNPLFINRNPIPPKGSEVENVGLANAFNKNSVFSSIGAEMYQKREAQALRWMRIYPVSGEIDAAQTKTEIITIDQESDFDCMAFIASAYSYSADANYPTSFPVPNDSNNSYWAMRGLTIELTDTSSGRLLTSGEVPFELIATPGYGQSFQNPFPFRYYFYSNSKLRIVIRSREPIGVAAQGDDDYGRSHKYEFAMVGVSYQTVASPTK